MGMIAVFHQISTADISHLKQNPDEVFNWLETSKTAQVDVDKAWAGINFLLTEDPFDGDWPLGFIFDGGETLPGDVGVGPAIIKSPSEMKELAAALTPITMEEMERRWDYDEIVEEEVYALGGDEASDKEYVLESYDDLRTLVLKIAENGDGMLHYIS